jgi:hypothetical protein
MVLVLLPEKYDFKRNINTGEIPHIDQKSKVLRMRMIAKLAN